MKKTIQILSIFALFAVTNASHGLFGKITDVLSKVSTASQAIYDAGSTPQAAPTDKIIEEARSNSRWLGSKLASIGHPLYMKVNAITADLSDGGVTYNSRSDALRRAVVAAADINNELKSDRSHAGDAGQLFTSVCNISNVFATEILASYHWTPSVVEIDHAEDAKREAQALAAALAGDPLQGDAYVVFAKLHNIKVGDRGDLLQDVVLLARKLYNGTRDNTTTGPLAEHLFKTVRSINHDFAFTVLDQNPANASVAAPEVSAGSPAAATSVTASAPAPVSAASIAPVPVASSTVTSPAPAAPQPAAASATSRARRR